MPKELYFNDPSDKYSIGKIEDNIYIPLQNRRMLQMDEYKILNANDYLLVKTNAMLVRNPNNALWTYDDVSCKVKYIPYSGQKLNINDNINKNIKYETIKLYNITHTNFETFKGNPYTKYPSYMPSFIQNILKNIIKTPQQQTMKRTDRQYDNIQSRSKQQRRGGGSYRYKLSK